jgi:hypothetical protein
MTDEIAPYSGAIEETAKTVGKAIDAAREGAHAVSRPVANIYGILIGDRIEAARERNLDAISRKTKKILKERDLAETAPVSEQIAIPLLEAARGESRDELQDLWATLLANAMDPNRRDDVRPEFISTLRTLQPIDALILKLLNDKFHGHFINIDRIAEELNVRASLVEVALKNLGSCLQVSTRSYTITSYGSEFVRACSGEVKEDD